MKIQELIKLKTQTYKYFTIEESLKAVKQNGDALVFVQNQTEEICLEAVKQDGYALVFVKENLFIEEKEMTLSEISEMLGFRVKIVQ